MHPAFEAAQEKLLERIAKRGDHPSWATPIAKKHPRLVTLRMFSHFTDSHDRYDLLLKVCPKCYCGFVYELAKNAEQNIKVISERQYTAQVKPYSSVCSVEGEE